MCSNLLAAGDKTERAFLLFVVVLYTFLFCFKKQCSEFVHQNTVTGSSEPPAYTLKRRAEIRKAFTYPLVLDFKLTYTA